MDEEWKDNGWENAVDAIWDPSGKHREEPYCRKKHHRNQHSQYYTTPTCPFQAGIEAVESYVYAFKLSIDRIKDFGYFGWIYSNVENIRVLVFLT